MKTACFYLTDEEIKRLDRLRGMIPRSRMGVLAVQRFLDDIESGRVELFPGVKTTPLPITRTTTTGDNKEE